MNRTALVSAIAILVIVIAIGAYYLAGVGSSNHPFIPATTESSTIQQASSVSVQSSSVISTTIGAGTSNPTYTVTLQNSSKFGTYLANATGFALYTYSGDKAYGNASACNSGCISSWPAFYAGALELPSGLNASQFGTIKRSDGTMQTTYKGLPLYLFAGDSKPYEVTGNGLAGFSVAVK